jgi:hypothetical protein
MWLASTAVNRVGNGPDLLGPVEVPATLGLG